MTKPAIIEEGRDRIRPHMDHWKRLLCLHNWVIEVDVYDHLGQGGGAFDTLMKADVEWTYRRATRSVNACRLADLDVEDVEQAVVHELAHCLVAELYDQNEAHHLERVVTDLSDAFWAVATVEKA